MEPDQGSGRVVRADGVVADQARDSARPAGSSNTRQVVVAWASSRPLASVILASAVAAADDSVRPSVRTGPVSAVIARMKDTLNSSVV